MVTRNFHLAQYRVQSGLLLAILLAVLGSPLAAEAPDPFVDEEPPEIGTDPGTVGDPSPEAKDWTLGDDLLPYDGDPLALDVAELYTEDPSLIGTDPSYRARPEIAASGCAAETRSIVPVKIDPVSPRYLSYRLKTRLPLGVSADAGCHLDLPGNLCNYTNHRTTLEAARASGLDKLRLWGAFAGEKTPNNVPFLYCTSAATTDCAGAPPTAYPFWRLDKPNPLFFTRLREVVAFAQTKDMLVEVTFFAPFEGDFFSTGPWGGRGRLPGANGALETVKLSQKEYAVVDDPRTTPEALENRRMREAQRNVILWTVNELWCFDNVWWEIANEPEVETVDQLAVAVWQKEMIRVAMAEEAKYPLLDRGGHLIAVQPFSSLGANQYRNDPNVDILNGHYTTVKTDQVATLPNGRIQTLDAGALSLVQKLGTRQRPFGFNETKITPFGGKAGTRAHVDGALKQGLPEPARAEAWEFLFDQGGIHEHWGYLSGGTPNTPADIRRQMGVLAGFLRAPIELGNKLFSSRDPKWVGINRYPSGIEGLDTVRIAHRYWASLQTALNDAKRLFLLYLHHSTPRCQAATGANAPEVDFTATGCPKDANGSPIFLTRNSYDARVWLSNKYQATVPLLDLGPANGTFDVQWITPATGTVVATQAIAWDGARKTCNGGSCVIQSPKYAFDIVLRVQQR